MMINNLKLVQNKYQKLIQVHHPLVKIKNNLYNSTNLKINKIKTVPKK